MYILCLSECILMLEKLFAYLKSKVCLVFFLFSRQ